MKPLFTVLQRNYPKSEDRATLYARIGWSDVVNNPKFEDTCAIRMSLALVSSGVSILNGNMSVHAGPLKGRPIEISQGKLSQTLKRLWGEPEVYHGEQAARDGIGRRHGVVSFFRIKHFDIPSNGGHIDLVSTNGTPFSQCARACYFDAVTVWFWPLD